MKKSWKAFVIVFSLLLLAGCSKKDELRPVSIGNLAFQYDASIWEYNKNNDQNAPLEFSDKNGNQISVTVSQESTYQHPLEMIGFLETMISTNEDFKVFKEPTKVEVKGATWYEYGYSYKDGSSIRKIYQRYYGKNYVAASLTYASTEKNYEDSYEEAIKLMSDVKATDTSNAENEAKAHKFLVGEWDLAKNGYLIFYDDSTYEWYKDSTKDKKNMHYGDYGCDVESEILSLKEGDGIYLVLFPEELIVAGTSEELSSHKIDYLISFDKGEAEGYQMVNMASYNLYTMIKQ